MKRPRILDMALVKRRMTVSFSFFLVWRPAMGRAVRAVEAGDLEEARDLAERLAALRAAPSMPTWTRDLMRRVEMEVRVSLSALANDPGQLDRAITLGEEALATPPTSWEAEALDRIALAEALISRFEQRADSRDVDAAISYFQNASELCGRRESTARPRLSVREGLRRWNRQFPPRKLAYDTVQWPPMDEFMRAHLLCRLAGAYDTRFQALWAVADLERAVTAIEQAEALSRTFMWSVSSSSSGYGRQRGIVLSQLAAVLVLRYEIFRDAEDIVRAHWYLKDADRLMPRRDVESAGLARNRVHALVLQAEALSEASYLDQAEAVLRRRQPRDPDWLPQVEIAVVRSELSGSAEGLDTAVRTVESRLVDATPAEESELLRWLAVLFWQWADVEEAHPSRPDADADPEAGTDSDATVAASSSSATGFWRRSADAWRRLALTESAPAWRRLVAASFWTRLGRHCNAGPAERVEAASLAVRLLPTAAWRGLDRINQEMLLTVGGGGLATTAAAAQLDAERPEQALELLELGRGVLWSQKLDGDTDLRVLREHSEELAARLTGTRLLLERTMSPLPRPADGAATGLPVVRATAADPAGGAPAADPAP
ncbi:hypothetical protein ACIQPQ_02550 [Streptomyces sp. NPDC091281]|uniref:hypothetical protein n=1 Tax=Streptomyces sp. NPDC091281 TaxID=3365985 RepID=UPI00381BC924